jgi:hypothetical protein
MSKRSGREEEDEEGRSERRAERNAENPSSSVLPPNIPSGLSSDEASDKASDKASDEARVIKLPQLDLRIDTNPTTEINVKMIDNYFSYARRIIMDELRKKGIDLSDCSFKIYISIAAHGSMRPKQITYDFNFNITRCAAFGELGLGNDVARRQANTMQQLPIDYSTLNIKYLLFLKGAKSEEIFKQIANKRGVAYPYDFLQDALKDPILPAEIDEVTDDIPMKTSANGRLSILNDPRTFQSYTTNIYPDKLFSYSKTPANIFYDNPGILALLTVYLPDKTRVLQYEIPIFRQFKNGAPDNAPISLSRLLKGLHYLSEKFNISTGNYNPNSIAPSVIDTSCSGYSPKIDKLTKEVFTETAVVSLKNRGRQPTEEELKNAKRLTPLTYDSIKEGDTESESEEPQGTQGTQEYTIGGKKGGKKTKRRVKFHKRRTNKKKHTKRKRKRITKRRHNKSH